MISLEKLKKACQDLLFIKRDQRTLLSLKDNQFAQDLIPVERQQLKKMLSIINKFNSLFLREIETIFDKKVSVKSELEVIVFLYSYAQNVSILGAPTIQGAIHYSIRESFKDGDKLLIDAGYRDFDDFYIQRGMLYTSILTRQFVGPEQQNRLYKLLGDLVTDSPLADLTLEDAFNKRNIILDDPFTLSIFSHVCDKLLYDFQHQLQSAQY